MSVSGKAMRGALLLAQSVLEEELQSLCESFCPPCKEGEVYDYSQLSGNERELIEKCEAALDAVEAALKCARGLGANECG